MFQSTHPCGVRPAYSPAFFNLVCFNPRTRVGCDRFARLASNSSPCFNPRTRVGCDPQQMILSLLDKFQSTHPCGVRPINRQGLTGVIRKLLIEKGSFNVADLVSTGIDRSRIAISIYQLRKDGYLIESVMTGTANNGTAVAQYKLIKH